LEIIKEVGKVAGREVGKVAGREVGKVAGREVVRWLVERLVRRLVVAASGKMRSPIVWWGRKVRDTVVRSCKGLYRVVLQLGKLYYLVY
jgi:hypothetical protein